MDKKIAGLLGAAAALTAVTAAQATPAPQLAPATSYRDLLDPIANAVPTLQAEDGLRASRSANQVAQISVQLGHHHHHHHIVVRRRHHHHHHHNYHHHHHHHHH